MILKAWANSHQNVLTLLIRYCASTRYVRKLAIVGLTLYCYHFCTNRPINFAIGTVNKLLY